MARPFRSQWQRSTRGSLALARVRSARAGYPLEGFRPPDSASMGRSRYKTSPLASCRRWRKKVSKAFGRSSSPAASAASLSSAAFSTSRSTSAVSSHLSPGSESWNFSAPPPQTWRMGSGGSSSSPGGSASSGGGGGGGAAFAMTSRSVRTPVSFSGCSASLRVGGRGPSCSASLRVCTSVSSSSVTPAPSRTCSCASPPRSLMRQCGRRQTGLPVRQRCRSFCSGASGETTVRRSATSE
mmetsp:Transcript_9236/g.27390  ORF Transcript_9236/g.27390 Transcript_9236/m.27390 type:complete len:240 (-) Transcript_9236:685-1404(-)